MADVRNISNKIKTEQAVNETLAAGGAPGAAGGPFIKAVVVEVINYAYEWDMLKIDYLEHFKDERSHELVPRNSLLVKLLDDANTTKLTICYPFFPSHLMLPIKPGEQVWVYDDNSDYLYWMCRISSNLSTEDVNFTHKDREFVTPKEPPEDAKAKEEAEKKKEEFKVPIFNNGAGHNEEQLPIDQDYEYYLSGSYSYKKYQVEPVPRYSPRVGDFVIQGSNNTLISLGTDRGWKKTEEKFEVSNAWPDDPLKQSGTIDIVAGRAPGIYQMQPGNRRKGTDSQRTEERTIVNTRNLLEIDKNTVLNRLAQNPTEGDPDFEFDLSRLYVSMNTECDEHFSLTEQVPIPFDTQLHNIIDQTGPAIVAKSNHIRIVARHDGSVRIIKEGDEDGFGAKASICMEADGTIHITGEKIFIGKAKGTGAGGGKMEAGRGGYPGNPGEGNPYVRYKQLEQYLYGLTGAITSFCAGLGGHTTPGWGYPSTQILSAASNFSKAVKGLKGDIPNFQSKRIFGE